ncbi:pirin family protein [Ferrimicrobium sp.]|uniref:pirin family protein n=1 Tax=Ferrimicrobium sp. TaxID=2926050 RepID=UPI00260195FD|nr:pirin family protein [Ferrimicrobium sp.]
MVSSELEYATVVTAAVGEGSRERLPRRLTNAPSGLEGEGFPVKRAFAGVPMSELDPFVHMDEMGEVEYGPGEPKGTPWHPHRGFETVTYMMEGQFVHQDSIGGGGSLGQGDTQWMTAGAGILHIERPPEELVVQGGLFHGLQLWVNLPSRQKWVDPRYQDIGHSQVGLGTSPHRDVRLRVIAGQLGADLRGPGVTYTPINMVHATLHPGARVSLDWPASLNLLVYVMEGKVQFGSTRVDAQASQLAVFGSGDFFELANPGERDAEVVLLGGRPIGEPVAHYGPFVMNTRAELEQAIADFQTGRMGQIPATHL